MLEDYSLEVLRYAKVCFSEVACKNQIEFAVRRPTGAIIGILVTPHTPKQLVNLSSEQTLNCTQPRNQSKNIFKHRIEQRTCTFFLVVWHC